jgi:hypothetical protein
MVTNFLKFLNEGNFAYNANDIISHGKEMVDERSKVLHRGLK